MRYQPLSRRLINLIYPLVIYMAIGMAVLGLYPNSGLMANLIEKALAQMRDDGTLAPLYQKYSLTMPVEQTTESN